MDNLRDQSGHHFGARYLADLQAGLQRRVLFFDTGK
jgi:hypothetical protein